ncbi:Aminoacyl tRNA synthase complex-interacting multifunctional protein 1 [Neolecta irregularis DAH-3]|uniref:Aminoacyl tRNA synthase complex-interacting multifunctional protein 1 n=1 Tax=Neolecta irregularis (strain DAH-3) TaxID=1198029 RepID=A0A1U7LJC7_NEOID|nr:Aminoacyl tRNA synthase complex-interacting multifunctional protein 1 [Neolecta irregularis DAH-3]|eukprot:OLL22652.1 Aminoacyl tRNA synthase complex-interacting multifunctional protein 1 [Neolecta irregularis DAH-3]
MPKRKLRGVWSEGMLLCGSKKIGDAGAAVELLRPPSNAKPGERVIATGQTVSSNPIDSMKSKSELKKIEGIWEEVVRGLGVDNQGHGVFQGRTLHVNGKGPCVCETIKSGSLY